MSTLTPQDFVSKWKRVTSREKQTYQEHFIDLCHLVDHQTPNEADPTGKRYAFELKGPLPNSDQTMVSKEKMFKILSMEPVPVDGAYYALPYNPYGSNKRDYKWSFPMRWFNMCDDPCVLIGNDFWDFIGGNGAYAQFVSEVNNLGKEYRDRIYREFLGIEPPDDAEDYMLK